MDGNWSRGSEIDSQAAEALPIGKLKIKIRYVEEAITIPIHTQKADH